MSALFIHYLALIKYCAEIFVYCIYTEFFFNLICSHMQASELRYVFSPLAIVADCYDKFFEGCVPKSSNFVCKEFG